MSRNSRNPISWVPTVYFAMGLPFVVLNMVSVLMFKGLGIDDAQIALWTSLIMLPWTLKFLWSPFLEMFKTKKFFVVLTQLITGAGFALVALALHLPAFFAVCIALLAIIAFSGCSKWRVTTLKAPISRVISILMMQNLTTSTKSSRRDGVCIRALQWEQMPTA